MIHHIRN